MKVSSTKMGTAKEGSAVESGKEESCAEIVAAIVGEKGKKGAREKVVPAVVNQAEGKAARKNPGKAGERESAENNNTVERMKDVTPRMVELVVGSKQVEAAVAKEILNITGEYESIIVEKLRGQLDVERLKGQLDVLKPGGSMATKTSGPGGVAASESAERTPATQGALAAPKPATPTWSLVVKGNGAKVTYTVPS